MTIARTSPKVLPRRIRIELLALDLDTCGRCARTDRNLEEALRRAASALGERGHGVEVVKRVISTRAEAERHKFLSSPTIRIDGRDIALDLRESSCDDCGELCGCKGSVSCRVWVWEGKEHLEAPPAMILDAILRAADSPAAAPEERPAPYRLPENLRTFFASVPCCGPETQAECCGTLP